MMGLTVVVPRMSIDVLVDSRVDSIAVVVLLQLFLGVGVGGRGVCGKTGSSRTGAPTSRQKEGLEPWNQTAPCSEVTKSGAPRGMEVSSNVHSDDVTTARRMTTVRNVRQSISRTTDQDQEFVNCTQVVMK